ncbi:hypothetical protein HMI56_006577 [Coelomomyces lativittatus]|nr:hypothetical protein HMI56_006577 [Coelomomyces lativittatus]
MWESGEIFLESSFLNSSLSKSSWILPILTLPFRWIVSLISSPPSSKTIPNEPFIALNSLKKSLNVLSYLKKSRTTLSEILLTKEEFLNLFNWSDSDSDRDLIILLRYAQSEGLLHFDPEHFYIKLATDPISEADMKVLSIKNTIQKLHQQVVELENKVESSHRDTKRLINENKKTKALLFFRRKKLFQSLLNQRLQQLSTIESMVIRIDSCNTEAAVLLAYQACTETLRHMLSKPGLQLEHIHATMHSLEELMLDHKEIDDVINSNVPIDPTEMESLELELSNLISPALTPSSNSYASLIPEKGKMDSTSERTSLQLDNVLNQLDSLPSVTSSLGKTASSISLTSEKSERNIAVPN